jgi:very-short-patch-repair endonuclease
LGGFGGTFDVKKEMMVMPKERARLVVGAEVELETKEQRRVRKWRERRIHTRCVLCDKESWHNPKDGLMPHICYECGLKHKQYVKRLGLGAGKLRMECAGCGKVIIRQSSAVGKAKCPECHAKKPPKPKAEPQVNTILRDKHYHTAKYMLQKQGFLDEYEGPLRLIEARLYHPGWWQSPVEIVVTAELIRLRQKVLPQKKITGHAVDVFLPDRNLVIEVDGKWAHGTAERRAMDIRQDATAILRGYSVARIRAQAALKDVKRAVWSAMQLARSAEDYRLEADREEYAEATTKQRTELIDLAAERIRAYHLFVDKQRYASQNRRAKRGRKTI